MKLWATGLLALPAHSGVRAPFPIRVRNLPTADDEVARLVVAAKYGSEDAFEALIERFAPRLNAVARRLVGEAFAPDMVQETFVAAYRGVRGFAGRSSFSTYLHAILIHRCRRHWRRQRPSSALAETQPAETQGPATLAENNLLRARVERAVSQLPEPFRLALSLRELSGLSYQEIAEVLRVSPGTVRSRIARARAQLRDALEAEGVRP